MGAISKHLNARQIRGLVKVGEAMIPGDPELPSFAKAGCVSEVDRILDFMPTQDLKDLGMLLTILGFLPLFLVAFVVRLLEWALHLPGPAGGLLRMIRLGLRGLVMSLYYGTDPALSVLGYEVKVYTEDLKIPAKA